MLRSRLLSIQALTVAAEAQLVSIKRQYEQAYKSGEISPAMAVEIKGLCENLRSALDYSAHEIRERCHLSGPRRFYFPILPTRRSFRERMSKWYPGLEEQFPNVWRALYRVQPFRSRRELRWLRQFNQVNNENKHLNLVVQTFRRSSLLDDWSKDFGPAVWIDRETMTASEFRFSGVRANAFFLLQQATELVPVVIELALEELPPPERPLSNYSLNRARPLRRGSLRSVKAVGRAGELRIR